MSVSMRMGKTFDKELSAPKFKKTITRKLQGAPPFSPCNAHMARSEIARRDRFLTSGTPYNEHRTQYLSMKAYDESKRKSEPFKPCAASEAKEAICTDYFMNSPRDGKTEIKFMTGRNSMLLE